MQNHLFSLTRRLIAPKSPFNLIRSISQLLLKYIQRMARFTPVLVNHRVTYSEYFCQHVYTQKVCPVLSLWLYCDNLAIFYMKVHLKQNDNWDYFRYNLSCEKPIYSPGVQSFLRSMTAVDCHLELETLI